ncbi:serine protease 58-like [Capricornis sumatraensis]|uniref:serine protease 58-like n=1 Tax=Capricornis sumatraensis TaxID=34865 RepID=UPI0036048380
MNGFLLVFTILTVAAVTTTGTPTAKQADSVKQFYQENVQNESTCLVFLNSEKDTCLGTLIHKQWVLTAAHCFLPFLEMEIAISDEQFQKRMESLRPMLIIPHPNFKQDSAEHDIALIKLTHPLKLNDQEVLAAPILCRNQLQGILSWSQGCVLRGDAGYYTKVSRYTDWIHRVIGTY